MSPYETTRLTVIYLLSTTYNPFISFLQLKTHRGLLYLINLSLHEYVMTSERGEDAERAPTANPLMRT